VTVTVSDAALASIAVTPATPTIEKGTTKQFTATGTYTDNSVQDITKMVTWKSATATVATVSNVAATAGLASAVGTGSSVISATVTPATGPAIVGSTTLTVDDGKLVSIAVTAVAPLTIAANTKLQFIATGTYDDGAKQDITGDVTWASDTAGVATVSNAADTGLVTGVAMGTAKISASENVAGVVITNSATLTVTNAVLVSIVVLPSTPAPSIAKGTTQQFTAKGFFSDGATTSTQDLTDTATWASSAAAVAGVSNAPDSNGLATGQTVGTANITATVGTIVSPIVVLTVTPAVLTSIAITPVAPATLSVAKGLTVQLVATGTYTDGTTQVITGTPTTWASATVATATISNANGSRGLATTVAVGTTDITATRGAIVGHATLTVTAAVAASIAVTPANPTIIKTHTQQFVATVTMTDGTKQNISATATWASMTEATATISTTGLATGLVAGTSQISATSGAVVGKTMLTVMN
jgi:hypothetical protein